MRRFLLVSLAILFSTLSAGLYAPYSAKASSVYDDIVQPVNPLVLQKGGSATGWPETLDVSQDWYAQGLETFTNACNMYGGSHCTKLEQYQLLTTHETANWLVLDGYQVIMTTDPSAHLEFFMNGSTPSLRLVSSTNDIRDFGFFNYFPDTFAWQSDDGVVNLTAFTRHTTLNFGTELPVFLSTFPIEYPPGYEGEDLPSGEDELKPPAQIPLFNYSLTRELDLNAFYVGNLDETYGTFKMSVQAADNDYQPIGEILDQKTLDHAKQPYKYKLPSQGKYIFTITYVHQVPNALPPDEFWPDRKVTFHLEADGLFHSGINAPDLCTDGVCTPIPITCSSYADIAGRLNCNLRKTFDTGLVGPSINAIRSLFSAFTVPGDPQCGFSLSDPKIRGQSFPISNLPLKACQAAQEFRSNFPIVTTVVNFAFSIFLLVSIVSLINRLTSPDKHDLVEGV